MAGADRWHRTRSSTRGRTTLPATSPPTRRPGHSLSHRPSPTNRGCGGRRPAPAPSPGNRWRPATSCSSSTGRAPTATGTTATTPTGRPRRATGEPGSVTFHVWDASLPPWQQPPFPNAGCPFGDFDGWRIVIDALYQDLPTRTYGMFNYGDDVYGDSGSPAPRWADITRPSYDVNIRVGTIDGAQTVDVTEISVEVLARRQRGRCGSTSPPRRATSNRSSANPDPRPRRLPRPKGLGATTPLVVGSIETIRD